MSQVMSLSICVSDIDKTKLTVGKNGKLYCAITVGVNDEKNQFGNDVAAWEQQTKEEREAKADRKYLGNGEVVWDSVKGSRIATKEEGDKLPF